MWFNKVYIYVIYVIMKWINVNDSMTVNIRPDVVKRLETAKWLKA